MALITCPECGNNVSDKAKACPKCGYQVFPPQQNDVAVNTAESDSSSSGRTLSIIGFIMGLVSWFLNFWGLVGIAAVVIGFVSLTKKGCNKTFAWIGIISGICNIIYACITIIIATTLI